MIKAALIATPLENDKRRILEEAEEVRKSLSEKLGYEVSFVSEEELKSERCKYIFVASGGSAQAFKHIFSMMPGPFVFITTQSNNSLAASMEELSYVQINGQAGRIVHGSVDEMAAQLEEIETINRTLGRLNGYRVGVLGSPNMLINSEYDTAVCEKTFGLKTTYISMEEVAQAIREADASYDESFDYLYKKESSAEEMNKALQIYKGVKALIEKYSFDAVSLRCFDLIAPLKATGCIALALLNSEGIPASCEGDTRSLLSMIVMNTLTGRPCFMANPSRIDVSRKTVVFAHCTLPLSMVRDYSLTTHFESGISVAVKGELEKGVYTVFKCFEDGRYAVQKAVFEENLCEATLCRTQIRLSCPDVDYFLTSPLGNHQIIVSGDHTECVNAFFSALKNWK